MSDNSTRLSDRRCGTCRRWRPRKNRDDKMDRWYGECTAPRPNIPEAYGLTGPFDSSSVTGTDCPAYRAGGKHGDKR